MKFNPIAFVINIAIPLAAGAAGAFFTATGVKTWYLGLAKPSFNPPNSIFPPVWTSLFVLMGISAYLVWQRRHTVSHFPRTIAIYLMQLTLNIMWSFIFFYAHQIGVALVEIVLLLLIVIINAVVFYRINKVAGLLFIPYILWVSFATVLTYNIFILN